MNSKKTEFIVLGSINEFEKDRIHRFRFYVLSVKITGSL